MKIDLKKFDLYLKIIIGLTVVVGAIFAFERYFAKTEEVEQSVEKLSTADQLIEVRLDLSIIEDRIYRHEQQIRRMKDWNAFEQKSPQPELTPMEKETLERAEKELERLRKIRDEKEKEYEERRKKN